MEWTSVDTDKTADTQAAVDNATDVVLTNKGLSDYHILRNYKDDICERVSYNDEAASGTMPYGDPWQIIYVFDDNPDTNVVCEGYAKAFKYLYDPVAL